MHSKFFLFRIIVLFTVSNLGYCCKKYNWNPFLTKTSSHLAILILARGGSKGINLKNIADVNGKPLIRISLENIKKVESVDSVWVSTDHIKILQEADKEYVNIHWRSAYTATDTATSQDGIKEFLEHHPEVEILGLVQCTSPFIKENYLQLAVDYMRDGLECAFSVTRYRSHKLIWKEIDDKVVPLNFNPLKRPRRQDWQGVLIENGMFYFATRNLIKNNLLQSLKYVQNETIVYYLPSGEVDHYNPGFVRAVAGMILPAWYLYYFIHNR